MTGVVVLIHGLFGDLESWGQTKEFLQDTLGRGYDVVEYQYESTVSGPNPSIRQIAGQLELWLNTHHPNVDLFLVGHSMGGFITELTADEKMYHRAEKIWHRCFPNFS